MVLEIENEEHFNKNLKNLGQDQLMLVDFTAVWCGPCQRIAPLIDNLSEKYPDVLMCKVDVDEVTEVAKKFKIDCMPTFVFIKNNVVLNRVTGANIRKIEETLINLTNVQH